MPRERMVTRTISTTKVEVMCLDITTKEVTTQVFKLGTILDNEKKILSNIQKELPTNVKAVAITSVTEHEELYGMSEQEFIEYANILDKNTKKVIK